MLLGNTGNFWDNPWIITILGGALSTILSALIPYLISIRKRSTNAKKKSPKIKKKRGKAKKVDIFNLLFASFLFLLSVLLIVFLLAYLISEANQRLFLRFFKALRIKRGEGFCYFFIALSSLSIIISTIEIVKSLSKKKHDTSGIAKFLYYILFSCLFFAVFYVWGSMVLSIHPKQILFVSGVLVFFSMPFFWWMIQALFVYCRNLF